MMMVVRGLTRVLQTWILLCIAVSAGVSNGETKRSIEFHVSPDGNDTASGRTAKMDDTGTDGPFATPVRALEAVRALAAQGTEFDNITITLQGGYYILAQPLVLTPHDFPSGATVVWRSAPGEKAILSGGRRLSGWRIEPDGLWSLDIPEVRDGQWNFHNLFINGERRVRSRHPNKGYFRTEEMYPKSFTHARGDVEAWDDLDQAMFFMLLSWESSFHHVESYNAEKRLLEVSTPDIPWNGFPPPYEKNRRYYFENLRAGLDQPGEWYLNAKTGKLLYQPFPDETPATAQTWAPALSPTLVELRGVPEKGEFLERLVFRDLAFHHSNPRFPRQGVGVTQAAMNQSAAIVATGLRESRFENCEIAHVGEHGLWVRGGSRNVTISHCHIHDLGAGGVRIGESNFNTPPPESHAVSGVIVDNCFIHDGSHHFRGGPGVWIAHARHNRISHNEIRDFNNTGISVGWIWGYESSSSHHNVIEFNHVYQIGKGMLADMGAIYTLGVSPGTVIRNNHIHDVKSYPQYYNKYLTMGWGDTIYQGTGVYSDEGSSRILIENNVIHDITGPGYFMNYGREITLRNNIIAFASSGLAINAPDAANMMVDASRNLVAPSSPVALFGMWKDAKTSLENNLYWHAEEDLDFSGNTFEQWQAQGRDAGSRLADPLFVDAPNRKLSLRADSPAPKLGFVPFDIEKAGLYGDEAWRGLPLDYPIRPNDPAAPPRALETIRDDFERIDIGRTPPRAVTYGSETATCAVTDEVAADGRHSLKFVDAEGQSASHLPHIYYEGNFHEGTMRFAFDFMNSATTPADVDIGMRDWRKSSFVNGPAIQFKKDGSILLPGTPTLETPLGQWIHVDVEFRLGRERDEGAKWNVSISWGGAEAQKFEIPLDPQFQSLTWTGIMAPADGPGIFYLDNLILKPRE